MDQVTKGIVEPVHGACEAHALGWGAGNFRTLRRYFWEFALPALMLAAMSALTAVVLVLLVTAAAELGPRSQDQQASPDPWSVACVGPAFLWDRPAYSDSAARLGMPDSDAEGLAALWFGSRMSDPLESPAATE
jgi:hypothetical protein